MFRGAGNGAGLGGMEMTPTKITLEIVNGIIRLRVDSPQTLKGYTVIESSPLKSGKSLDGLRKHGTQYAKRFSIPFVDATAQ
jgi:hypothetical protein